MAACIFKINSVTAIANPQNLRGTRKRSRQQRLRLPGPKWSFLPGRNSRRTCDPECLERTVRLLRHERAAISEGLKGCSTVTSEKIRSRSSARDSFASKSSICSRVLPLRFMALILSITHLRRTPDRKNTATEGRPCALVSPETL